ncbi:MAG: hypothetical protein L3J74_02125 [Bacteroidales bacterium]|nr:hypothetical protein [Bacteroidales bacterium]
MTTKKQEILDTYKEKSEIKQKVFSNTFEAFNMLREVLKNLAEEYNKALAKDMEKPRIKYKNRGKFQVSLKFGGDLLIFSMHTNVYEFDRDHHVWKTRYARASKLNTYSGIINIYNFLSDSFKYNRLNDLGYLIGRIFINNSKHYFVEGKRQMGYLYKDFGTKIINEEALRNIVESALQYILEFDLLVPKYDQVKIVNVEMLQTSNQDQVMQTGKRLGFQFNTDDIHGEEAIYTGH